MLAKGSHFVLNSPSSKSITTPADGGEAQEIFAQMPCLTDTQVGNKKATRGSPQYMHLSDKQPGVMTEKRFGQADNTDEVPVRECLANAISECTDPGKRMRLNECKHRPVRLRVTLARSHSNVRPSKTQIGQIQQLDSHMVLILMIFILQLQPRIPQKSAHLNCRFTEASFSI